MSAGWIVLIVLVAFWVVVYTCGPEIVHRFFKWRQR